MNRRIFKSLPFLLIFFCSYAQNPSEKIKKDSIKPINIEYEALFFYSESRCNSSCNRIEKLTKETIVRRYPSFRFVAIDIDEKKNRERVEYFGVKDSALFLWNIKTGEKKKLSNFAFIVISNEDQFIKGLRERINKFLNR